MKFYPRVNVTDYAFPLEEDKKSLQVPWHHGKKSVKDIQKRIRTRPRAKCLFQNNSKIGIDKQKSEWCATGNIACTGENYSACGYMCNYISRISFHSKILPMKSARWKDGAQNLGNVSIKWNVCYGIPYSHHSAPVLHLQRGGVTGVVYWYGSNFNKLMSQAWN